MQIFIAKSSYLARNAKNKKDLDPVNLDILIHKQDFQKPTFLEEKLKTVRIPLRDFQRSIKCLNPMTRSESIYNFFLV